MEEAANAIEFYHGKNCSLSRRSFRVEETNCFSEEVLESYVREKNLTVENRISMRQVYENDTMREVCWETLKNITYNCSGFENCTRSHHVPDNWLFFNSSDLHCPPAYQCRIYRSTSNEYQLGFIYLTLPNQIHWNLHHRCSRKKTSDGYCRRHSVYEKFDHGCHSIHYFHKRTEPSYWNNV